MLTLTLCLEDVASGLKDNTPCQEETLTKACPPSVASRSTTQQRHVRHRRSPLGPTTMASPAFCLVTRLVLVGIAATAVFASPGPRTRTDGRFVRAERDEIFLDTPGSPQNLCGESSWELVVDRKGPLRDDCALLHRTVEKNLHGFWIASDMGQDGTAWVEFTRLRSCALKVRRTDGQSGDVP